MSKGVGFYNKDWFAIKENKELLYESIIRILMTAPGERVMRPDFGAGMRDNLFELIAPDFLQDLAISIHSSLMRYEPRLIVKEVQTEFDSAHGVIRVRVVSERDDDPDETEVMTFKYNVET
jgi:phage baseplate assembly protein W